MSVNTCIHIYHKNIGNHCTIQMIVIGFSQKIYFVMQNRVYMKLSRCWASLNAEWKKRTLEWKEVQKIFNSSFTVGRRGVAVFITACGAKVRRFESPSLLFFRRSDGFGVTLAGNHYATQLRDENLSLSWKRGANRWRREWWEKRRERQSYESGLKKYNNEGSRLSLEKRSLIKLSTPTTAMKNVMRRILTDTEFRPSNS